MGAWHRISKHGVWHRISNTCGRDCDVDVVEGHSTRVRMVDLSKLGDGVAIYIYALDAASLHPEAHSMRRRNSVMAVPMSCVSKTKHLLNHFKTGQPCIRRVFKRHSLHLPAHHALMVVFVMCHGSHTVQTAFAAHGRVPCKYSHACISAVSQ